MTKQIEGVSEKILACAKEEFLEKGYSEASLRTIAAKADTTTGSIYSRFRDKEGLFSAIVFKTPISTKKIQNHKILLCKKSLFSLHKQNKEIPYKKS